MGGKIMPFIKDHIARARFDKIIEDNKDILVPNGNINYLLYALCKRTVPISYNNIKGFAAELEECARFIKHKLLDPYEDVKEIENGEIL
jgi:hypothetical protein